MKHHLKVSAS